MGIATDATNVLWVSATQITCDTPVGAGNAAVVVINPDTQNAAWGVNYVYGPDPTINPNDGVQPIGGPLAGGNTATINGSGYQATRIIGVTTYPLVVINL